MSSEDIYKVARNIFGRYGAFFNIVAREIGMDKALELHAEAHRDLGVATADTIRESMKGVEFDLGTLGPLLRDGNISHGLVSEMVETPSSILLKNSRCPVARATPTDKEYKFGVFDGKQQKCGACGKTFNAFYRDGKFSHTVPKAK